MVEALKQMYELIYCNFLLSYPSRNDLQQLLRDICACLVPKGVVVVKENEFQSSGTNDHKPFEGKRYLLDTMCHYITNSGLTVLFKTRWKPFGFDSQYIIVAMKLNIPETVHECNDEWRTQQDYFKDIPLCRQTARQVVQQYKN